MKRFNIALLLATLTVFSCVTINIYFPAEEVRGAADRIVDEVWGERTSPSDESAPAPAGKKNGAWLRLFTPASAMAAQDIDVSTPEIRGLRASMKERSGAIFPFLDSGNIGLGNDGLLKVRSTDGLALKQRGEVNRLVNAENEDRMRLYGEIARANGFPEKAAEVQSIFAESWRAQAAAGWYYEGEDGAWRRK